MLYVVEVEIDARNLAYEMGRMRNWLDRVRFEPIGFRQVAGSNNFRIDFGSEPQAKAFAEAFAGHLLSRAAA